METYRFALRQHFGEDVIHGQDVSDMNMIRCEEKSQPVENFRQVLILS